VLDRVDWHIAARSQYVILGQHGAGKTTLLDILSGLQTPTEGWVERNCVVSPSTSLIRYGTEFSTPTHLIARLARVYHADPEQMSEFVASFSDLQGLMHIPLRALPRAARQRLNVGLFYSLPCDFYLFDSRVQLGRGHMRPRCTEVFEQRRRQAGMVLATSNVRAAMEFGGTAGVLHEGSINLYRTVEQAVSVFEKLPPPKEVGPREDIGDFSVRSGDDDGSMW
jgi:capsular polysaccharide transport system ATP-binding protein